MTNETVLTAAPPLSARSVALSLLLGSHPPRLSARDLTTLGEHFGIATGTMRVALSRMTAAGDLVQSDASYTLARRHLERQAVTDVLIRPETRPYGGTWRMVVIMDRGRPAADRTALREQLTRARLAELREGVWLRPDNLVGADPEPPTFLALPPDDRALVAQLWDLDAWSESARRLLSAMDDGSPIEGLTAAAAAVRHLRTDPALPVELAPAGWPADELRAAYDAYRIELTPKEKP